MTTNGQGQVTHLALRDNGLSGSLPATLGKMEHLQALSLDRNSIGGSLPVELGNLSNLTRLAMNRNSLSGSIPTELGSLSNLSIIGLARNQLSGSLPVSLGNLSGADQGVAARQHRVERRVARRFHRPGEPATASHRQHRVVRPERRGRSAIGWTRCPTNPAEWQPASRLSRAGRAQRRPSGATRRPSFVASRSRASRVPCFAGTVIGLTQLGPSFRRKPESSVRNR